MSEATLDDIFARRDKSKNKRRAVGATATAAGPAGASQQQPATAAAAPTASSTQASVSTSTAAAASASSSQQTSAQPASPIAQELLPTATLLSDSDWLDPTRDAKPRLAVAGIRVKTFNADPFATTPSPAPETPELDDSVLSSKEESKPAQAADAVWASAKPAQAADSKISTWAFPSLASTGHAQQNMPGYKGFEQVAAGKGYRGDISGTAKKEELKVVNKFSALGH
ncbi:hypothetical protein CAOG_07053 [Capsaspora owczarzaki ATCC 30864]|uniref:Uncharacterized protein n=1 Tax=Capsaspora owczarzaki (strain ATCC 30864) TaxID=595528 RepID=A0A0D2WWC6_CAPO3|nr:hypothetical protein CAOG_07053 [Capsaspora owczarzaki ATCC 30864]KJE96783.1 hypothetical protein CAOG_007053 [Capsaspora owczarzaki ATCC 30864]|eukprot:XP_004343777.1 hypothetical protein CAOG_07053 [Capsaspora owczarzaki ATCC 30864]